MDLKKFLFTVNVEKGRVLQKDVRIINDFSGRFTAEIFFKQILHRLFS